MVEMASATMVAPRAPVLAAVGNVELAAAMTAAKKTGKQGLAASHGAAAHETLTVGVVADQALIPFKLGPRNVSVMMVEDQNSQTLRSLRKPRTIRLRPDSMVMRLPVRPNV
jgi:hypothetical protein